MSQVSGCGFPPRLLLLGWPVRNSSIALSGGGPCPRPPLAGRVIGQQSEQAAPYSLVPCLGRGEETKSKEEGAAPEPPSHEEGRLVKEGTGTVLGA